MPNDHAPGESERDPMLTRLGLTAKDVQGYEIKPAFVGNPRPPTPPQRWTTKRFSVSRLAGLVWPHRLNVEKFRSKVEPWLQTGVIGCALQLRKGGVPVLTIEHGQSRNTADGARAWTVGTQMHVASVSKLVTAIALTRCLDLHGIPYSARIEPWLPTFWSKGPGVSRITFRDLLTNKTGLKAATHDYLATKQAVANGTTTRGTWEYRNLNWVLGRILLATVNGDIDPSFPDADYSAQFPAMAAMKDELWDLATIIHYRVYVGDHLLDPAGVPTQDLSRASGQALAYDGPTDSSRGWNSGELEADVGSVGWHFCVNEILDLMATFRRKGTIMSRTHAERMLTNKFGIDHEWPKHTPMGPIHGKGGWWQDGSMPINVEQSSVLFLPGAIEVVALANSPHMPGGGGLIWDLGTMAEQSMEPVPPAILFASFTQSLADLLGKG